MDEVEAVARPVYKILEGPFRDQDFLRQKRQWELAQTIARAAIAALDKARGPSFMDVTLFDAGVIHGREAGLREAAAWVKANAPVGMMEGDDYEREILALINAKG